MLTSQHSIRQGGRRQVRGFSLLEILVTLLIVSFALLGAAGLQLRAIRTGQGNQFRTQAILLASDMSERMDANKAAAKAGSYAVAQTSTVTAASSCYSATCGSPSALATADIYEWEYAITHSTPPLPGASWSIVANGSNSGNPVYQITISWVDRRSDAKYSDTNTGETFSYKATKTLY